MMGEPMFGPPHDGRAGGCARCEQPESPPTSTSRHSSSQGFPSSVSCVQSFLQVLTHHLNVLPVGPTGPRFAATFANASLNRLTTDSKLATNSTSSLPFVFRSARAAEGPPGPYCAVGLCSHRIFGCLQSHSELSWCLVDGNRLPSPFGPRTWTDFRRLSGTIRLSGRGLHNNAVVSSMSGSLCLGSRVWTSTSHLLFMSVRRAGSTSAERKSIKIFET